MTKSKEQADCIKAIDEALMTYVNPSSRLHQEIRNELILVRDSIQYIERSYSERRAAREAADKAWEARAIAAANKNLEQQQKLYEKNSALGNPELTTITENGLTFARQNLQLVKKQSEWRKSLTKNENSIDAGLQTWIENMTGLSVRALSDDVALERALAIASASSIAVGLSGGTAAIFAAVAAAAILARDVWKNATKKGRTARRDKERAREEAAKMLLVAIRRIASDWQAIVSTRAAPPS